MVTSAKKLHAHHLSEVIASGNKRTRKPAFTGADDDQGNKVVTATGTASDGKVTAPTAPLPSSHSKLGILLSLLRRAEGATLTEMMEATGWQKHSIHGTLSGRFRKRLGLIIRMDSEAHGRVYRVVGA